MRPSSRALRNQVTGLRRVARPRRSSGPPPGGGPRLVVCALLAALGLSGCTTVRDPIPEGHTGPLVWLADTGAFETRTRARLFAAVAINCQPINNAVREVRQGGAHSLSSILTVRGLPVAPMRVKLLGTHHGSMPILEIGGRLTGQYLEVEGEVDFQPIEGKRYEVTGKLDEKQSCVWIIEAEDRYTVPEAPPPRFQSSTDFGSLLAPRFEDSRVTEKVCKTPNDC